MTKVALLIGVSEYQVGLNPLPKTLKDIDALQKVLMNPEMGEFPPSGITVLKNPGRQQMETAIYSLYADRHSDDLILFYFSGHGLIDERGQFYLASCETRKDSGRLVTPTAVAARDLHDQMNGSNSKRQVVILDCCFSGAFARGLEIKDGGEVDISNQLGGRGRAILTSSTATQFSFVKEDSTSSVYTRYLIEGIETGAADLDSDGWITADELHIYASKKVRESAPGMTPKFYPVEEGYTIQIAKSLKNDPELEYRKEVGRRERSGKFSVAARKLLNRKFNELGLTEQVAVDIEAEVLRPYREYEEKLEEYQRTFFEAVQTEYPLNEYARSDLEDYQRYLGLRDEDIAAIESRIPGTKIATSRKIYKKKIIDLKSLKQSLFDNFSLSIILPNFNRKILTIAIVLILVTSGIGLLLVDNFFTLIFLSAQKKEVTDLVRSFSLVKTLNEHEDAISSIAISPDNKSLVSGSHDSTVRVWDIRDGKILHVLSNNQEPVLSVAISEADGQVIASGGIDGVIRLWDLQTGEESKSLQGEGAWVTSLAFSPNGKSLISGRTGNNVDLWNLNNNEIITSGLHYQPVLSVAVNSNLGLFASGSSDRTIKLWDVISGTQKRLLEGHTGWVTSLAFDKTGDFLVSGSMDGTVRIWNLEGSRNLSRVLRAHSYSVSSVAIDPSSKILASGGFNGEIRFWDLENSRPIRVISGEHTRAVTSLVFSLDGTSLVSGSADNTIKIWRSN